MPKSPFPSMVLEDSDPELVTRVRARDPDWKIASYLRVFRLITTISSSEVSRGEASIFRNQEEE